MSHEAPAPPVPPAPATELPLLPLPHMVLLPGEELPLHVFAARYCSLVRAVLGNGGLLAAAAIRPEELTQPPRDPAVEAVACVARIDRHELLPDGSFFVWLRGVAAARLGDAAESGAPFRRVAVTWEPAATVAEAAAGVARLEREARAALPMLMSGNPEEQREVVKRLNVADADGIIALVAHALDLPADAKQRLLEEPSRAARCLSVGAALEERVRASGGVAAPLN